MSVTLPSQQTFDVYVKILCKAFRHIRALHGLRMSCSQKKCDFANKTRILNGNAGESGVQRRIFRRLRSSLRCIVDAVDFGCWQMKSIEWKKPFECFWLSTCFNHCELLVAVQRLAILSGDTNAITMKKISYNSIKLNVYWFICTYLHISYYFLNEIAQLPFIKAHDYVK